jgi:hypothetical protein
MVETNICPGNDIISSFRERNNGWVRICSLRNVYGVNVFDEGQGILRDLTRFSSSSTLGERPTQMAEV